MHVVPSVEVTQALKDLVAVESHIILRQGPCNPELLTQWACTDTHDYQIHARTQLHTYTHTCPPPHTVHDKQTGGSRPDMYISCLKAVECAYVANDGIIQIPHQTGLLSHSTQTLKPSDLNKTTPKTSGKYNT